MIRPGRIFFWYVHLQKVSLSARRTLVRRRQPYCWFSTAIEGADCFFWYVKYRGALSLGPCKIDSERTATTRAMRGFARSDASQTRQLVRVGVGTMDGLEDDGAGCFDTRSVRHCVSTGEGAMGPEDAEETLEEFDRPIGLTLRHHDAAHGKMLWGSQRSDAEQTGNLCTASALDSSTASTPRHSSFS